MYAYGKPDAETEQIGNALRGHDASIAHLAAFVLELRDAHLSTLDRLIETTTLCSAMASELARLSQLVERAHHAEAKQVGVPS